MKIISFVLILVFTLTLVNAEELTVSSYVDKTELAIDEYLSLTIEISSDKDIKAEPIFPQLTGFQIVGQSSSSFTSIEITNGKMSKSVTKKFIYTLEPIKIGKFYIPPILVKYQKKEYHTKIIKVEVHTSEAKISPKISSTDTQKSSKNNGKKIFLEAVVNRHSAFVGEPVIVSYKLYSREKLVGLDPEKFPEFSGFIKEETYQAKSISSQIEVKNGIRYFCYRISEFTLFPTYAGKLAIEPMLLICAYQVPSRRFFGTTKKVKVKSNHINLNVSELPNIDKPENFSGAVGEFYIGAKLNNTEIKTGESITFTVTISGAGNIKMFDATELPKINNVEIFAPEVSNILSEPHRIQGKKIVKHILIPEEPGEYVIPEIPFVFFDTQENRYRQISTSSIKFTVTKGDKHIADHYYVPQKEIDIYGSDICFIKTENKIKSFSFVFYTFWYWMLACLALLSIFAANLYRYEQKKFLSDRAYFRLKIADKDIQKDLKEIKSVLSAKKFESFFILSENALKNYIANKLNLSAVSAKIKDISDALRNRKISDNLIKDIEDFLILTDQVRFSGKQFTKEEIDSKFMKLDQIIRDFSKIKFKSEK